MAHHKCPLCKRTPAEPINLRCEHHPCFNCIQPHLSHEPTKAQHEEKFKIICPACHKKTVLYDLRHLLVCGHQEEGCFVSDKFIEHKSEVKVQAGFIRYDSNYLSGQHSGQHTRRGSIHSVANGKLAIEVKCSDHGQPYKYFCSDCSEKAGGKNSLLCSECAKPHYNSGHKLLSLRQAESKLQNLNYRSKEDMTSKQNDLTYMINYLNHNKVVLDQYFAKLEENLSGEFKAMYAALQNKYNSLRGIIKSSHEQQIKDIAAKIDNMSHHQGVLQSLKDIELKDLQANAKFYQTFHKINLSSIRSSHAQVDFNQLPHICKYQDCLQKITEEWIYINNGPKDYQEYSVPKKTRRQSNVEEQYSHRSVRDKENFNVGLSPSHLKPNSNQKKFLV